MAGSSVYGESFISSGLGSGPGGAGATDGGLGGFYVLIDEAADARSGTGDGEG